MQNTAKRYGFIINQEKCIGCYTCVIACKMEHQIDKGSYLSLETEGGGNMDTPAGTYPGLSMHFRPHACMHCEKPPCLEVCPSGAIIKREDGIVLIEEDSCNGCSLCVEACPYQAIKLGPEGQIAKKCDMCVNRVDKGLEPFCALCCEGEAILFGNIKDKAGAAAEFLARNTVRVLKEECGTAPAVYYHKKAVR
ncbi:MAG: 4Fe-4S dicluster domain-containing protein [Candidatus Tectomicrobia bacterium]|uniref:4Fe-4S dicluster domain-containing protein n=1 Tax=Tectimicrobiota bacterium TaxID=2528274 RepID=A0A933LPD6_UNCTE|nr:4Fe-4S dicluster domain-containing protein [Candidatus Tectomicrobia bacterium]